MSEVTPSRLGLDAASMARLQGRAMCLMSAGVVHGLNNALAIVSTHVQVAAVPVGTLAPAFERAGRCLWVLDQLSRFSTLRLDAPGSDDEVSDVAALLRAVAESMICERGAVRLGVEAQCPSPLCVSLPSAAVLVATLLAVESVAEAVPALLPGRLIVSGTRADGGAVRIGVSFVPEPGHLPFQVARPPAADLRGLVASLGGVLTECEGAAGLTMTLPELPAAR
jgi:hypothetical protein